MSIQIMGSNATAPKKPQKFTHHNPLNPLNSILSLLLTLVLVPSCSPTYISMLVTPTDLTISKYTTYSLVIYRYVNPVTSTFTSPVSTLPSTAYIQLIMPSDYSTISNVTSPVCANTQTGGTLTCTIDQDNNVITITGMFTNTSARASQTLYITLYTIKNPSRAQSSGNFQLYIKYTNGTIIDQSPSASSTYLTTALTFTAASFTSCVISANSNYISTRSVLTFTMVLANAIPSTGILVIDVPLAWDGDMQGNATVSSTPTCTAISGISSSSLSCSYTILGSPLYLARITVSSLSTSGIAASTTISLSIAYILTPPYLNDVQTIAIYSQWSDGVYIDTCTSKVTNLTAIPFKYTSFTVYNGSSKVQTLFTGLLQLTLNRPFYYQDVLVLTVPTTYLTNSQISITSLNFQIFTTTVTITSSTSTYATVSLSNFPSSPSIIASNNVFTLYLINVTNGQSTQPITITCSLYRYEQLYQTSAITYTPTIGTFTYVSLQSDSLVVNYIGASTVAITSQYYIKTGGTIQITYSSSISASDVSKTNLTYAALNSVKISNTTYTVSSNVIYINSLFKSTFSSGSIQITIPSWCNPPSVKPTAYNITVYSSSGYSIGTYSYTMTASLSSFTNNSIGSSSYTVLDTNVIYTLTFYNNYPYKAVSIIIPPQVTVSDGYSSTCSPNTYSSCTAVVNTTTLYTNLTYVGGGSAGTQVLAWGYNTNPPSFQPSSSFQVYTYTGGYGVERSTGYLTLTMSTQNTLVKGQVIPSSYINNANISIQIDYTLPARTPSGWLTITIPTVVDISSSTCTGTNISSCTIISPKVIINYTSTSTSTTHPATLILSSVKNAPSYKPIDNIVLAFVDLYSYASLAMSVSAWTNIYTSTFVTVVTSDTGYKGETAVFTFTISGLSGKQTYINIKINQNFGALSTAPLTATLINSYQVRYNISGEGSSQLSMNLTTPVSTGAYTFSLKTYTSDNYSIGTSTSNAWTHTCYGTQCKTCLNTTCLSCYNSSITSYYIFNTADGTCIRACPTAYYLDTSNNCNACSSNCSQCVNLSTTCTSCPTSYYLNTIYYLCVLICDTTYYKNNYTFQCTACISPCYTCTDSTTCTFCVSNYYLLPTSSTCESSCPSLLMVQNSVNRTCDYCDSECLTCSISAYNCTSCNNTLLLYLDSYSCVYQCTTQKYLVNNICVSCKSPCKLCYNSTTTCISCYMNSTLWLWYNYNCITTQQCAIGHYVNSVNGSCDACPSTCSLCISYTNCTGCASNYYLYSNTCVQQQYCPNTTYADGDTRKCISCDGCVTCTNSTYCTSCKAVQYLYEGVCYSACGDGLYAAASNSMNVCVACDTSCPTCINATYCTSCITSMLIYKGVCYSNSTCPTKTYPSSTNSKCIDCPVTCKTCTSSTNCLTCSTGYSLQNSLCVLSCSIGLSYNQVCYPCGLNCALCTLTTGICTLCDTPYLLLSSLCVSECSQSTISLDSQTCISCTYKYVNCTTCNDTQCLSCSQGALTDGQCVPCSSGYYTYNSKCVTCPSVCGNCLNQTYCTSCASSYYMYSNYCVGECPKNMVPNGTVCDVCIENCAICDQSTLLCSVCVAGMYMYQGECYSQCPSPYVISLNYTLCVTQQEYAKQYSSASKAVYFPFSIAGLLVIAIGIGLKCYINTMHLGTFLVAVLGWVQLISWILFGIVQYVFYRNWQTNAIKGIVLVLVAVVMLILCNFVFLKLFFRYFSPDIDYIKWVKRHTCINIVFLSISTIFTFKFHRMIYSKTMDRQQLSLILSSTQKLIPVSILSMISLFCSSVPVMIGAALALYYSLSQDQQFFNALDTLTITSITTLCILVDLKHPHNYFIDQVETNNIKNKIYQWNSESINVDIDKKQFGDGDGGMSRENFVHASAVNQQNNIDQDFEKTAKKFRSNNQQVKVGREGRTRRVGDAGFLQERTLVQASSSQLLNQSRMYEDEEEQIQIQMDNQKQQQIQQQQNEQGQPKLQSQQVPSQLQSQPSNTKWVPKQFDHYGYLIKYDKNNEIIRYDRDGNIVKIDQNGVHHKYDENGYEVIVDEQTGQIKKLDNSDGFFVGADGHKYDKRNYRVEKTEKGIKYYDENGYQVITKQKYDKFGNLVKIDNQNQHHFYNKQGYQVIYDDENGNYHCINQDGVHIRQNKKTGEWECYDQNDGFILKKNTETGEYVKYDENGFKIQKDQYGNIYRYDDEGNRVIIQMDGKVKRYDKDGLQIRKDPQTGEIRKYDKQGYQMKKDPLTGQKIFYDQNGYRVERDYYGHPTLYDSDNNMIIIDKETGRHHKYNAEGLQIIQDGNGGTYLIDKRGRKVVEGEDGSYQKFDQQGNRIWLDEDGYEIQQDENGVRRYDKVGNLVQKNQEEDQEWGLSVDEGDQAVADNKKKRATKNYKNKELDLQEQYSKMVQMEKPNLLFNFENDEQFEDSQNLREFHDFEPIQKAELQREYQTLYAGQQQRQQIKRDNSFPKMSLQELGQIDHTPYQNIKQKKVKATNKNEDEQYEKEEIIIDPEENHQKHEVKSVADISISQRSFVNDGVRPMTSQSRNSQQQDESLEDVYLNRNQISDGNFDKNRNRVKMEQSSRDNKSLQNEKKKQKSNRKKHVNKIYDSEDEVESLQQQQWQQNETPDLFYKDHHYSNTNDNTNDNKGLQIDDQSDVLSDFIIPQTQQEHQHKSSESNLFNKKHMQSIEEAEDQLFDKLKSEDNRVKRSDFKLSGAPNPLVQYAKTIDAKKMKEEMQSRHDRYAKKHK